MQEDRVIAEQPGGWAFDIPGITRCNGMPVIKTDYSNGPHRGSLYVSWSDQRNGTDNTDIWLIRSSDKGVTWSAPIKVNTDKEKTHQFFPQWILTLLQVICFGCFMTEGITVPTIRMCIWHGQKWRA